MGEKLEWNNSYDRIAKALLKAETVFWWHSSTCDVNAVHGPW